MVGVLRAQPHARPVVEPQPTSWLLFLWNLQPLTTPDPLHPVLADMPACPSEQRRNPAIAIAAILAGQRHDGLGECVFVVSLRRPVARWVPRGCFTTRHASRSLIPCASRAWITAQRRRSFHVTFANSSTDLPGERSIRSTTIDLPAYTLDGPWRKVPVSR
jgi:hypothetical protein